MTGEGGSIVKRALILPLLALLAACTSLMPPQQSSPPPGPDYLNDDLAGAVLAFDLPNGIEPIADASTLSFTIAGRQVVAALARGDIGEVAGTLPPPAANRTYYLFTLPPADQAKLREAQFSARTPGGTSPALSITPRLCAAGPVDTARVRISVLLALPGSKTVSLINNQPLPSTGPLPACAGHSG